MAVGLCWVGPRVGLDGVQMMPPKVIGKILGVYFCIKLWCGTYYSG